ncbi:MAG: YihY/virulence factor BrkB family protein [Mycobacteriales bacterium]|nr:YihY/virulence factor BrkB family protein [Mycobacteriales bacterium]
MTTPAPVHATPEAERRSAAARASATAAEAARPLPRGVVRGFFRLVADVWRKSDRDRVLGLGAENAFMAVLTVFPTLIVVAAVLGQLSTIIGAGNARDVENSVLDFLREILTSNANPAIETAQELFRTSGDALTLALVLAFASLAQAFASIINTVTVCYDVHDRRGWWWRRALGLVVGTGSILVAVVVVTLVVVGPLFAADEVVGSVGLSEEYAFVWAYLRWPVAFLSLVLWATTMFHLCPDRAGPWRQGLSGALLTAILWLGASVGFNLYLEVALDASPVFSALGGGLIVMTWMYLLCVGLLGGAELNAVLLARRELRRAEQEYDEEAAVATASSDAPSSDSPVPVAPATPVAASLVSPADPAAARLAAVDSGPA